MRDLRSLDVSPGPDCQEIPDASSLARAIGVAYVLEGSTLGGRYILSRLPPAIAAVRGTATAFLEGYGVATGDLWRGFGAIVERTITSDVAAAEAVAGARDAFARLVGWLARFEHRATGEMRGIA